MVPQGLVIYRDSASDLGVEMPIHDRCPVSGQGSFEKGKEQHSSGVGRPHHCCMEVETPVEIPLGNKLSGFPLIPCKDVRALAV